MSYLVKLTTSQCFYDQWILVYGLYWACDSIEWRNDRAWINMSATGGTCPGGERHRIKYRESAVFSNGFKVEVTALTEYNVTIRISEIPDDPGFGFGKAEITQTNIGPGIVFNVGSSIEYSLRVMNTGDTGKIYGVIGLGYHDKDGNVYFTGRYANEQAEISSGEMNTWNGYIEVLHKDYAAREMTPRGPAVYFMSGHEENNKIVWDRSEYIPVELELESGYIDPTDPEGVPDDWDEPIYEKSDSWGDFWDIITPKSTPEPEKEPEKEPVDIMPFLYIGFAGLIGYMLIKG